MNMFKIIIAVLIVGLVLVGLGWYLSTRPAQPESDIVARKGMHWHPELKVSILGQVQKIPAGIGLGVREMPIHTHEIDGVIHLEFSGLVKKDDIKLGRFFEIWGKQFSKDCIFDKCSGPEGQLKMLVNGKENFEFENYMMRDQDEIEIIFEKNQEEQTPSAISAREIAVSGTEFSFSPSSITINKGEKIKITFTNNGSYSHNLVIEGLGIGTKTIGSGQTESVEFTAPSSGNYNFFCSVAGHRASGMEGNIIVQ